MRTLGWILLAASCAGCGSSAHQIADRSDFLAEGTRTFQGEPRERVIAAAERVLRQSDPQDFEFRHNAVGFTGLRRYVIYAVIAAANGREKWEFTTEQVAPNAVRAAITVSEAGQSTGGGSTNRFEGEMASVPLYRLFWKRVEYVLGRRPDWVYCEHAVAELDKAGTNSTVALGGLCGPTSDGRGHPPPEVLERPPVPVAAAPLEPARTIKPLKRTANAQ